MRDVDTLMLVTDTRKLKDLPQWSDVAHLYLARLSVCRKERWGLLTVDRDDRIEKHLSPYWMSVHVAMAVHLLTFGEVHIVLLDSDAAPTVLWDVADIVNWVQPVLNLSAYDEAARARPGILVPGEPWGPCNAGLVIIVAPHKKGENTALRDIMKPALEGNAVQLFENAVRTVVDSFLTLPRQAPQNDDFDRPIQHLDKRLREDVFATAIHCVTRPESQRCYRSAPCMVDVGIHRDYCCTSHGRRRNTRA